MKFDVSVKLDFRSEEVTEKVLAAARLALRDIVVDVAQDAKQDSPVSATWPSIAKDGRVPTGNNKRSIAFEMGPGGDLGLDDLQGAVYSTSGYGGYLETGTRFMPARPYLAPAVQRNFTEEKMARRTQEHLNEGQ